MPYSEYICPDGKKCKIEDCLQYCRLAGAFEAGRCLSKRTLQKMAEQREWSGLPSTTQLISGTRCEMLKLTTAYAVDPQDLVFALFGSGVHAVLEETTPEGTTSEERLSSNYCSGAYDHYDPNENGGTLYDVKTYGSYKTMKVMGLKKVKEPIFDEYGIQRKYRNGRLMYNTYYEVARRDRSEVAYQLNDYRMKIEAPIIIDGEEIKRNVNNMIIEIITRDAGTFSARDRGITTNAQLVKVNKISDDYIEAYFKEKSRRLIEAVETGNIPPVCKPKERWGGKTIRKKNEFGEVVEVIHTPGMKCERFCPVWFKCELGIEAQKNSKKGESTSEVA